MANYHLEVQVLSRGKGRSVSRLVNYISGKTIHDSRSGRTFYIGVMTCLIAGFFCRPTRRLTSIICKICAMRLKPLRFAGMLGQRGSSRVLCRMSCHCRSCKASLPILSAAALFRMTFAQSRLFTRVSTHLIHRATIRILTSSCQPVPSSQMASAG